MQIMITIIEIIIKISGNYVDNDYYDEKLIVLIKIMISMIITSYYDKCSL